MKRVLFVLCIILGTAFFQNRANADEMPFFYQDFETYTGSNLTEMGLSGDDSGFVKTEENYNTVLGAIKKDESTLMLYSGTGEYRFRADTSVFEDAGNCVVLSYDAYFPNSASVQSLYSIVGFGDINGKRGGKWPLGIGAKVSFIGNERKLLGFDYPCDDPKTKISDNAGWITQCSYNVIRDFPNTSDMSSGRWVNFKVILKYDASKKAYISQNYVDNKPLLNESGDVAQFEAVPDAEYSEKIRNRGSLVFCIGIKNDPGKKENILIDNVGMYLCNGTDISPVAERVCKNNPRLYFDLRNTLYAESTSVPSVIKSGAIDAAEFSDQSVTVTDGEKDVTEFCDFEVWEDQLVISCNQEMQGEQLTVKFNDIKDIYQNKVDDREFSFSYIDSDKRGEITAEYNKLFPVYTAKENVSVKLKWENSDTKEKILALCIKNDSGEVVYKKGFKTEPGENEKSLDMPILPIGWYRADIEIGNNKTYISYSVVYALSDRRDSTKSGMGLMTCLAHSEYGNRVEEVIDEYIETLKLAGCYKVRELVLWRMGDNAALTPYETKMRHVYKFILDKMKNSGMDTTVFFHDATDNTSNGGEVLPNDLLSVYKAAKAIGENYGDTDIFEIWNEPDLDGESYVANTESADKFAAFCKATMIGLKDSGTDADIVFGAFSKLNSYYASALLSNDISTYSDRYNFHDYSIYATTGHQNEDFLKYRVKGQTELAYRYGFYNKPIMNTEYNEFMYDETADADIEMQKEQALYGIKASVANLSSGVDESYYFIHQYYQKGNLGDMDKKGQPRVAYNAVSAFTNALGNAKYKAELTNLGENTEGYYFYDELLDESMVCLWSDEAKTITLNLNKNEVDMYDFMGQKKKLCSDNGVYEIETGPEIKYYRFSGKAPSEICGEEYLRNVSYKQNELTKGKRVILSQEFEKDADTDAKNNGHFLSKDENSVKLHITNLNDTEVSGVVHGVTDKKLELTEKEKSFVVGPMQEIILEFTVKKKKDVNQNKTALTFNADIDGYNTTCTAMIYTNDKIVPSVLIDDIDDAASWKTNQNSETKSEITSPGKGKISYYYQFDGSNMWAAPIKEIEKGKLSGTDGFTFDVTTDKDVTSFIKAVVYVTDASGSVYSSNAFLNGENTQVCCLWDTFGRHKEGESDGLDPAEIVRIQVGFYVYNMQNVNTPFNCTFTVKEIGGFKNGIFNQRTITGITSDDDSVTVQFAESDIPIENVYFYVDGVEYKANVENNTAKSEIQGSFGPKKIGVRLVDSFGLSGFFNQTVTIKGLSVESFKITETQEEFTASAVLNNYSENQKKYFMVFAGYNKNDDTLETITSKCDKIDKNQKIDVGCTLPNVGNRYYKAFLLDPDTLKPLCLYVQN